MTVPGRVHNGVVVLEADSALPEGAIVTVTYTEVSARTANGKASRVYVPLVKTGHPGSVILTGDRIAQILDEDDAAP